MNEIGFHVRTSLEDRRVIAPGVAERRALARAVLRIGRDYRLAAFRAPDDHLHMLPLCDRRQAGQLVRRVEIALQRCLALPVGFEPPYIKPLADQRHGYGTFRYIMRQDEHHGLEVDPWGEASNLPDLLGLRLLGGYTSFTVGQFFPRITEEELASRLGIRAAQLREPMRPDRALEDLAEAAAAAAALPDLRGRSAEVVAARQAAMVAVVPGVRASVLAKRLGVTPRVVQRQRALPHDPMLVEAVQRQLRLRGATTGLSATAPDVTPVLLDGPAAAGLV